MASLDIFLRDGEIFRSQPRQRAASPHAEWLEDFVPYIVDERAAGYLLHEVTDQCETMIRITDHMSRLDERRRHRSGEVTRRGLHVLGETSAGAGQAFIKTSRVGEQMVQVIGPCAAARRNDLR